MVVVAAVCPPGVLRIHSAMDLGGNLPRLLQLLLLSAVLLCFTSDGRTALCPLSLNPSEFKSRTSEATELPLLRVSSSSPSLHCTDGDAN